MGQQQLLLVILVTIIVGIATVVAINTFGTAADQAARDAVTLDLVSIAAASQGYYIRPAMLGGGSRSFTNIDFNKFSFTARVTAESDGLEAENENARYVMSGQEPGEFVVTAFITDQNQTTIAARICPNGFQLGDSGSGGTAPDPPACI